MSTDWVGMAQGGQNSGQSNNTQSGITNQASDLLRSIGLGVIPNFVGMGTDLVKAATHGGSIPAPASGKYSNPFLTPQEANNVYDPSKNTGEFVKNGLGVASWMVPEVNAFKGEGLGGGLLSKVLSATGNHAIQGVGQGALGAASQGQDPVAGGVTGAVVNPAMAGAGNLLTDVLPRYIGMRNFGLAGAKLPEVVTAENAAKTAGEDSLKSARSTALAGMQNFELNPTNPGGQTDRQALIDKIHNLASQPEWTGTPGLSELTKTSSRAAPTMQGEAPNLIKAIQNSNNAWEAYNKVRNMAYPADNSPASTRLAGFMTSAAHSIREHLINTSENPETTRNAMDMYAAQTAMSKGGQVGGNKLVNILGSAAQKIGPDVGMGALAFIPGMQGLAGLAGLDTAITNPVTGPTLARGLVNAGNSSVGKGVGSILTRLGITGAQNLANGQ